MSDTLHLKTRLADEADQCRHDGAEDIAGLLDDAINGIASLESELAAARETARRLMAAERATAERDAARDDGMRAAASILDAEHAKRSHLDNHAAYYARMIREHIGR